LGAHGGKFLAQALFATGAGPRSALFADLDGDTKLDVLAANYGGNSISVLFNRNSAACGPSN
jgi:hypothetical protein